MSSLVMGTAKFGRHKAPFRFLSMIYFFITGTETLNNNHLQ